MDNQLQKLIELSRKTGDRLIAFDSENKTSPYVVMAVDDYEKLAIGMSEVRGLTEDELLDKINRDIAIWKSDKIDDDSLLKSDKYSEDEDEFDDGFVATDDDWYSVDEIVQKAEYINNDDEVTSQKSGGWSIPSARKKKAEEIIEEDRYYLEDIED